MIPEKLFKILKVPSHNISAPNLGLNNGVTISCNKVYSLVFSSWFKSGICVEGQAFVIPKVIGVVSSCYIELSRF